MKPSPVSEAERASVLALHAQGLPRNEIARQVGRSTGTVSAIAKAAGLTFTRATETRTATAARKADLSRRRAAIVDRTYTRMEALLDRLEADQWQTVLRTDHGQQPTELAFIPAAELQSCTRALSDAANVVGKLERTDESANPVANLLTSLADALNLNDNPTT